MNEMTKSELFAPAHAEAILRYGKKDEHLNESEIDWIPYVIEQAAWKPLRFDVTRGQTHALLRLTAPGVIGRHQHRGSVMGFVIEGSWYYQEYDWVATPGSIISESPGGIHTLVSDNPTGMVSLFVTDGVMDFFGDNGTYAGTQDTFWNIDEYLKHCQKHGLEVNDKLFYS